MKDLIRIYNIIELFKRKPECSLEDILKAASKTDINIISKETWYRLHKKMDHNYGFRAIYHKGTNSYTFEEENKIDKHQLMCLIKHFKTMEVYQYSLDDNVDMIERIELDEGMNSGDEEHIERLQMAMLNIESAVVIHQGYYKEDTKELEVYPLYFKQYQNRWYLIVELAEKKVFRALGMDRIKEVRYKGTKFVSRIKEAKARFSEVVGVDLQGNGLQDIVIAFAPSQKPYLETLKLHHSQTVVEDTEEKYIIKIRVNPNYELQQQIQKFGSFAEVVEGDWVCLY